MIEGFFNLPEVQVNVARGDHFQVHGAHIK